MRADIALPPSDSRDNPPVPARFFSHLDHSAPGADRRTLLLLHSPAGDEHELLPLAQALQPTAGILSPRGQIDDQGCWRFFRRLIEGPYDLGDLQRRRRERDGGLAASRPTTRSRRCRAGARLVHFVWVDA